MNTVKCPPRRIRIHYIMAATTVLVEVAGMAASVASFTSFEGMAETSSNFKINVERVAKQMCDFMNSAACGAVIGVSISHDFPGMAFGIVAHQPPDDSNTHVCKSLTWSSKCFSSRLVGNFVTQENVRKTLDKVVVEACADVIATTARFATHCNSSDSACAVLFSPGSTVLGALCVQCSTANLTGIAWTSKNLGGAITSLAGSMLAATAASRLVDVSVGMTDHGAYGAVWYREGTPGGSSLTASTVQSRKAGMAGTKRYHETMGRIMDALPGYQGRILFDYDAMQIVCQGLVLHEAGEAQPPALNVIDDGSGCCSCAVL